MRPPESYGVVWFRAWTRFPNFGSVAYWVSIISVYTIYLIVMVGIIVSVAAVSVPWLFRLRCPACRTWNRLDSKACQACGAVFPPEYE